MSTYSSSPRQRVRTVALAPVDPYTCLPVSTTVAGDGEYNFPSLAPAVGGFYAWRVEVDGAPLALAGPKDAIRAGVVLVPVKPGAKKGMPAKIGDPVRHAYHRLGPATVQVELTRGGGSAAEEELNSEA